MKMTPAATSDTHLHPIQVHPGKAWSVSVDAEPALHPNPLSPPCQPCSPRDYPRKPKRVIVARERARFPSKLLRCREEVQASRTRTEACGTEN